MAMEGIVYEDEQLIVFHKPGGLAAQTRRFGQEDVVSRLKNYRAQKREEPYLALINRLDQPVEGLLLAAKTKRAAAALSDGLNSPDMEKYYRAVVVAQDRPLIPGETGDLTDYLLRDGRTNYSRVAEASVKGAKQAILHYQVLRARPGMAELWILLKTGRHHQIRVQLAHANMPILGDCKYGGTAAQGRQLALCSSKIIFMHPQTKQKMVFETKPKNPAFQLL